MTEPIEVDEDRIDASARALRRVFRDLHFSLGESLADLLAQLDLRTLACGLQPLLERLKKPNRDLAPRAAALGELLNATIRAAARDEITNPNDARCARVLLADVALELFSIASCATEDDEPFEPLARLHENEPFEHYAQRVRANLPAWPSEVVREWLYRHWTQLSKYRFLGFGQFRFARETWPVEQIPGVEALDGDAEEWAHVLERAATVDDWVARHLRERGTWNTPIVLLDNRAGLHAFPRGALLKKPWHLLEGHHRLAYLTGLRATGCLQARHEVFVVSIERRAHNESAMSG